MSETLVAPEMQRRAADPTSSIWVAASAGTGKTKVLIDRVLNLLLAGAPPQRLLCLTFTKAAAKEMAIRLTDRLSEWAIKDDARLSAELQALGGARPNADRLAEARRLFARVLDAPGGLKIDTIHAFCQSLLRRFPLEAGLPPHFRVLDERGAAELMAEARDDVLTRARDDADGPLANALGVISGEVNEQGFADLMAELTRERARLARALAEHRGEARLIEALRARLGLAPGDTAEGIRAGACAEGAFDEAALAHAAAALCAGSPGERARGASIADWLARLDSRVAGFDEYLRAFLTAEGKPRVRLAAQDTQMASAGTLESLNAEAARLAAVVERLKAARNAVASAALVHFGAALIDAYDKAKLARAALDYDDLILATRDLLRRPGIAPWVLFKLDGGLDHILIDEAQDTNPEQWEVIEALAEEFFTGAGAREVERTVFAVGDAKQSIFSFQRADPVAFVRMRDHFERRAKAAAKGWDTVPLTLSFRSTGAILDAVDAVFAQARAHAGVALDGAPISHDSHRRGEAGLVELWPPVAAPAAETPEPWAVPIAQADAGTPRQTLARIIASTIAGWVTRGETLESKGRPIRPSDVLILVRRRNSLVEELVRALKQVEIDVAGVDRMVLSRQLAIMDLVALGRFLLLPEDDLTLATVLKGPLFNLTEEQLFALAHGREGALWRELRRRQDEDAAFAAAHEELADLLKGVDFTAPYELFSDLLARRGGRRRIIRRLGLEADDPLDEFLAAALAFERAHPPSLEGFLHWLEAGEQEIKRDMEAASRDEVRIMTVHGAKGLQAPIVIVPDTLQVPTRGPRLLWQDGLPLWSPRAAADDPLAAGARAQSRVAREAEYRRLLYVALTRAQDRLYICGYETGREAPAGSWYHLIEPALRQIAKPIIFDTPEGLKGEGLRLDCSQEKPVKPEPETAASAASAKGVLPSWWNQPPPREPAPARPLVPSAAVATEPAVRSPFGPDDGARFKRGLLIHRLLQTLPDLPRRRRKAAAKRFLARKIHALSAQSAAEIARETLAVLDQPGFGALFGAGSIAEAPIVGLVGGRAISGQIDRLVVSDHEVLIVDYKTNRPPPTEITEVSPLYLAQMAAYRAALQPIYPGRRIRCALLWTDGPRLMELPRELLDASAPMVG